MFDLIFNRDIYAAKEESSPWSTSRTLIWFAFWSAFAVYAVAVGELAAETQEHIDAAKVIASDVWSDRGLFCMCIVGATLGTALKVAFFPTPELDAQSGIKLARVLASKATVSMVCGMVVTPMLIRYSGWTLDFTVLVFWAATVAFGADAILAWGVHLWGIWSKRKEEELTK